MSPYEKGWERGFYNKRKESRWDCSSMTEAEYSRYCNGYTDGQMGVYNGDYR